MPWQPRPYQQDSLDAFDEGYRRQMLIWHRRAGKDNYGLNLASLRMQEEIGNYWHLFPLHVQARRAIWKGIDKTGQRFIDQAFPEYLRAQNRNKGLSNPEMMVEFENGSTWQMLGSDAYDRLVGANTRGCVFSEWALCDPKALEYIRPIIRENDGWMVFITTYRGHNHAWKMARDLKDNPHWYVDIRTVDDTYDSNGRRIITDEDVDRDRAEGMPEALIQQEYYCNPSAVNENAVYAESLMRFHQ